MTLFISRAEAFAEIESAVLDEAAEITDDLVDACAKAIARAGKPVDRDAIREIIDRLIEPDRLAKKLAREALSHG